MANFIIVYHAATSFPSSQEEGEAHRAKWGEWIKELGDAMVNPGTPLGKSMIVSSDGVSETDSGLTGYTVVEAPDLDAAVEFAKGCPYLDMGPVEVAEMKSMGG